MCISNISAKYFAKRWTKFESHARILRRCTFYHKINYFGSMISDHLFTLFFWTHSSKVYVSEYISAHWLQGRFDLFLLKKNQIKKRITRFFFILNVKMFCDFTLFLFVPTLFTRKSLATWPNICLQNSHCGLVHFFILSKPPNPPFRRLSRIFTCPWELSNLGRLIHIWIQYCSLLHQRAILEFEKLILNQNIMKQRNYANQITRIKVIHELTLYFYTNMPLLNHIYYLLQMERPVMTKLL